MLQVQPSGAGQGGDFVGMSGTQRRRDSEQVSATVVVFPVVGNHPVS